MQKTVAIKVNDTIYRTLVKQCEERNVSMSSLARKYLLLGMNSDIDKEISTTLENLPK